MCTLTATWKARGACGGGGDGGSSGGEGGGRGGEGGGGVGGGAYENLRPPFCPQQLSYGASRSHAEPG